MRRRRLRPERRVGLLLAGVVILAFLSVAVTVVLPALDPAFRKGRAETAPSVYGYLTDQDLARLTEQALRR